MKGKWKWVAIAIAVFAVIGAIASNDDKASSGSAASSSASSASISDSEPVVSGKVAGTFHRDCLSCYGDDLSDYVSTSNVWCGWQDDKVVVHVRMTNHSVEHVTVTWHPSYTIVGGGGHGEGLTSEQDAGFDAGETRDLLVEQSPDGVAPGSALGACKPSFSLVQSG